MNNNPFQKNLLELIQFLKTIEADVSLLNYEKMVYERPSDVHEQLFSKIYQVYKNEIVAEDFSWLLTKEINIIFGKTGKSVIRLSHFYTRASQDQRVQIEGMLINCLVECVKNEEDKTNLNQALSHYLPDETPIDLPIFGQLKGEGKQLFGEIASKLKNSFEKEGQNGASDNVDPNVLGKVVQDLMTDKDLQQNIFKFAEQINLPQLLGNVFQNLNEKK